jgi:hypothetical protein
VKIAVPVDYAQRRAEEYPSLADQLDALWKGGAAAEAMREQIMAIKATYPKPAKDAAE